MRLSGPLPYRHIAPPLARAARMPRLPMREPFSSWRAPQRAAITTEDGIVAGMLPPLSYTKASFTGEAAGYYHNLFAVAGNPAAGALAAPGLNGATVDDSSAIGGMFRFDNPSSGNAYLSKLSVSVGANILGFLLYDLLWYNTGIAVTTTTAQNITFPTLPSRCVPASGSTPDALGGAIEIWIHCATATTNAGVVANTTMSYTNQANAAGRTGTIIGPGWPITAVAGTFWPIGLSGSDTGVRSVQSITLGTSYGAGAISLFAIRRVAFVPFVAAISGGLFDWAALGFPRLYNDSALYMAVLLSGTAAGNTTGDLAYSHG